MANRQKDDTYPSRYMKRRLDLAEADNIINEMLINERRQILRSCQQLHTSKRIPYSKM